MANTRRVNQQVPNLNEIMGQNMDVLKFIGSCEEFCAGKKGDFLEMFKNFDVEKSQKIFEVLNSMPMSQGQTREDELKKEIASTKLKLEQVNEAIEISKAERKKIDEKIQEIQNKIVLKIKKETENLGTSVLENPSEYEIQWLEKLTEKAKEKAKRTRILQALQQKENYLKEMMNQKVIQEMETNIEDPKMFL